MKVQKLIGYDLATDTYTNPISELVELLPSQGIITTDIDVDGYEDYLSVTAAKLQDDREFEFYVIRQRDGLRMYLNAAAKARNLKQNGVITPENYTAIEEEMKPVRDELVLGQIISARDVLVSKGIAVIGQEMYDEYLGELNEYISKIYF